MPDVERRMATAVGNTGSVPAGTMLTVPSVSPSGDAGDHPIVAVNVVKWYKDPTVIASLTGAFLAVADPVIEVLVKPGPIRWRSLVLAVILAFVAWLRQKTNTIVK